MAGTIRVHGEWPEFLRGRRTSSFVNVDQLDQVTGWRVANLLADIEATHGPGRVLVVSAVRTYAEQRYLYDGYRAGRPGFNQAANPDANPQTAVDGIVFKGSRHQEASNGRGHAVDLRTAIGWDVVHSRLAAFGLGLTVPGEAWHIEARALRGYFVGPWPVPGLRTLHEGLIGGDVQALQTQLGIAADGQFGPATAAAVRAEQARLGAPISTGQWTLLDQAAWTAARDTPPAAPDRPQGIIGYVDTVTSPRPGWVAVTGWAGVPVSPTTPVIIEARVDAGSWVRVGETGEERPDVTVANGLVSPGFAVELVGVPGGLRTVEIRAAAGPAVVGPLPGVRDVNVQPVLPLPQPEPEPEPERLPVPASVALGRAGVDVSMYQAGIDWPRLVSAGAAFGWVKATEGVGYIDPEYSAHVAAMNAAGVRLRGAYHFGRPDSGDASLDDADAEAAAFIAAVADDYRSGALNLTPVLDLETFGTGSPDDVTAWALRWLETVDRAIGRRPMLYGGAWHLSRHLNGDELLARYGLWLAEYGVSAPSPAPAPWTEWEVWQHTTEALGLSLDVNAAAAGWVELNLARVDDPTIGQPRREVGAWYGRWLHDIEATVAERPLTTGVGGPHVFVLQAVLVARWGQSTPVDGMFSPATGDAVRHATAAAGIGATDVVGPDEWRALIG